MLVKSSSVVTTAKRSAPSADCLMWQFFESFTAGQRSGIRTERLSGISLLVCCICSPSMRRQKVFLARQTSLTHVSGLRKYVIVPRIQLFLMTSLFPKLILCFPPTFEARHVEGIFTISSSLLFTSDYLTIPCNSAIQNYLCSLPLWPATKILHIDLAVALTHLVILLPPGFSSSICFVHHRQIDFVRGPLYVILLL